MCIIAIKPKGVEMPDKNTIEEMWYSNKDGFGLMYPKDGKVIIDKGYMKYKSMWHRLDQLKDEIDTKETPVIMHFRIGTAGGNIAANTHPFPVSATLGALQKTRLHADLGVVHNGIISGVRPRRTDISDTMEYILSQLAPLYHAMPHFYTNKDICEMIYNAVQGKLAFMNGKGNVYTIGDFIEDGGMLYSNHSYKVYKGYSVYDYDGGSWKWEDWIKKYPRYAKTGVAGWTGDDYDEFCGKKHGAGSLLPWDDEFVTVNWLTEDHGYIRTKNGEFLSCDDGVFMIDEYNRIYEYDLQHDLAVRAWNLELITHNGTPYVFDYDTADMVPKSYDKELLDKPKGGKKGKKEVIDLSKYTELALVNADGEKK